METLSKFPEIQTLTQAINVRTALEKEALAHSQTHTEPTEWDKAKVGYLCHMSEEITRIIKDEPEGTHLKKINEFINTTPEGGVDLVKEIITTADPKIL